MSPVKSLPSPGSRPPAKAEANDAPAPVRILIIDDHPFMRDGVRGILGGQAGWEVAGEAGETDAGWAAALALRPDVVILDLDLPGAGGQSLLPRISERLPGTKTVVLTGDTDPEAARRALTAGAWGYLRKSAGAPELVTAVAAVLAGRIYLCTETTTALVQSPTGLSARPAETPASSGLSPQEKRVLTLVAEGLRNKEIADQMEVSIKSVETYRARLMRKLGCATPAEMIRCAIREGVIPP